MVGLSLHVRGLRGDEAFVWTSRLAYDQVRELEDGACEAGCALTLRLPMDEVIAAVDPDDVQPERALVAAGVGGWGLE